MLQAEVCQNIRSNCIDADYMSEVRGVNCLAVRCQPPVTGDKLTSVQQDNHCTLAGVLRFTADSDNIWL